MENEWHRLEGVVTALAGTSSWRSALDGVREALTPAADVYRTSHRGRRLSGRDAADSFWIAHMPELQPAVAGLAPFYISQGPAAGWWVPWQGGCLRSRSEGAEPPRWLLSVATLLDAWSLRRNGSDGQGEAIKALHQLNELSWVIHGTPDLPSFLRTVPEAIGRHLGASHCALIEFAADDVGRISGAWEQGRTQPDWAGLGFSRLSPLGRQLSQATAGRWQPDPGSDFAGGRTGQILNAADTVLAPIRHDEHLLGLLVVRHPHPRSPRLLRLLCAIAEHVAVALQLRRQQQIERQHNAAVRAALQGAPAPLALLSGDGTLLQANDAAQRLIGGLPAVPTALYRFFQGQDRQRLTEAWLDLEGGRNVVVEHATFHRPDGTAIELGYRLNPIGQPGGEGFQVVMSLEDRAISSRQARQWEQRHLRWQSLGEALPLTVAMVDAGHRVVWAGRHEGPVVRHECCHPLFADPDGGPCLATQALSQGLGRIVVHRFADGSERPIRVWPVHDDEGDVIGAIAMALVPPAPPAWREAERLALLGRLVGPTRHDLHNALGVIHGRIEAQRLDGSTTPHLAAIERATERMTGILHDLATWQAKPGEPAAIDLGEAVRATVALLEAPLRALGLHWQVLLPEEPVWIWAHREDVRLLFAHVLLAPGKQRPPRTLALHVTAGPAWADVGIDGWPDKGSHWIGESTLAAIGGRWQSGPGTARPHLQLPRWLAEAAIVPKHDPARSGRCGPG